MEKRKYEKPVSRNLSSIEIAHGSCVTGNVEYKMLECSTTGSVALTTCAPTGSVVFPAVLCLPLGNAAGYSCVSGHEAG